MKQISPTITYSALIISVNGHKSCISKELLIVLILISDQGQFRAGEYHQIHLDASGDYRTLMVCNIRNQSRTVQGAAKYGVRCPPPALKLINLDQTVLSMAVPQGPTILSICRSAILLQRQGCLPNDWQLMKNLD